MIETLTLKVSAFCFLMAENWRILVISLISLICGFLMNSLFKNPIIETLQAEKQKLTDKLTAELNEKAALQNQISELEQKSFDDLENARAQYIKKRNQSNDEQTRLQHEINYQVKQNKQLTDTLNLAYKNIRNQKTHLTRLHKDQFWKREAKKILVSENLLTQKQVTQLDQIISQNFRNQRQHPKEQK